MVSRTILAFCLLAGFVSAGQEGPKQSKQPGKKAPAAPMYEPTRLQTFMERQINADRIRYDNSWKKGMDDTDYYIIGIDQRLDTIPAKNCNDFPFKDIKMKYCMYTIPIQKSPDGCDGAARFSINGHKMPMDYDCERIDPMITPATIRRFNFLDKKFIIMWGGLKQPNGYGDRIQFNYFFDVSNLKHPVEDVYTNISGYVYYSILYGDLNNDNLLDRIVFDGISDPFCDDTCTVRIEAQTYKNNKWRPLRDKKNRPYFIKVRTDGDMDDVKVVSSHWMKPLK